MKKNWKIILAVVIGALFGFAPAVAQQVVEVTQGQGYGKKGPWLFGSKNAATGVVQPLISSTNGAVAVAGMSGTGSILPILVDGSGALEIAGGTSAVAFAPGVPTKVTLSASTSATACGLTAGADYEVSCSVPVAFRHGAATPTATLDDNQLPAAAVRTPLRMPAGSTCLAFISSSAGACYVSLIPTS